MDKQEHLLVVMAEELGELGTELLAVQKMVFKALRFGLDDSGYVPATNIERINAEWQDLLGSVEKLRKIGVELKPDLEAIANKMAKIDKYCDYAQSQGKLNVS